MIDIDTSVAHQTPIGIDFGTTYTVLAFVHHQKTRLLKINDSPLHDFQQLGATTNWKLALSQIQHHSIQKCQQVSDGITRVFRKLRDTMHSQYYNADKAVITVPICFNLFQKTLLKQAVESAGWSVVQMITEPSAALISLHNLPDGYYGVCDVGGGTFDFSILNLQHNCAQVINSTGSLHIGGTHFDSTLQKHLYPERSKAEINKMWANHSNPAIDKALAPYVDQIHQKITACIDESSLHINTIFFTGGVGEYVLQHIPSLPTTTALHPHVHTGVAMGAAAVADKLLNTCIGTTLIEHLPLSVGIENLQGSIDWILHKNAPLPITSTQQFVNIVDQQTKMKVKIFQGWSTDPKACHHVHTIEIPITHKDEAFEITLSVDTSGILSATIQSTSDAKSTCHQINIFNISHNTVKSLLEK